MFIKDYIGKKIHSPDGKEIGYARAPLLSPDKKRLAGLLCSDAEEEDFLFPLTAKNYADDPLVFPAERKIAAHVAYSPLARPVYDENGVYQWVYEMAESITDVTKDNRGDLTRFQVTLQEGKTAAELLQKMLTAGFPAPYALRSLNSLCALRGRGGAVTVDLAEIELSSGKLTLYKWGAPPSYITGKYGAEKLGASTPPPGLSVTLEQERAEHSSLKGERLLLMVSDGVTESAAFRCCMDLCGQPEQTIAEAIMFCEQMNGQDDATVIAVRLE